jgi:glucose-1-phosphate cytidylyltransferase
VSLSSGVFEPWKIHVIDTGKDSMTGGRMKRVKHLLEKDENFMMTYGDGVADIDIKALVDAHEKSNKLATVTATYPSARFGALDIQPDGSVSGFKEKPTGDGNLINGGFFVLSTKVLDLIKDDSTVWEQEPMVSLASQKQLNAFVHKGFWTPMDTLRDKHYLNELLETGAAPWKTWD